MRPGNRPGQRHGERKGHGIGSPARPGRKGDNHGQELKQDRQEEVGDALAELVDQKDRAAGLGVDAADGNCQQQDDGAEHDPPDAVVKPGHEFLEIHTLGQGHARRQQQRRSERPVYVGRASDHKGADGNPDQGCQRQKELQHVRAVAVGHVAGLQFPGAQRFGAIRIELAGGARALHGRSQPFAEEKRLFDTQQKGAEDGENGVETERHALKEKTDAVGFSGQKPDTGDKDERLHIARPGVEGQL